MSAQNVARSDAQNVARSDLQNVARSDAQYVARSDPRTAFDVYHSASPEETAAIGERIGARLSPGALVLLVGSLGAGKTIIAKGIAKALGVAEPVLSPTFTIVSEYATGASTLYHIDLYRIEGREQQENLGLDDILRGEGIVLVEWGEKLDPSFAGGGLRVIIDISPDGGRDIRVEAAVSAAVSRQRTAPGTMG